MNRLLHPELDAFISAEHAKRGLGPSPEVRKEIFLRRVLS